MPVPQPPELTGLILAGGRSRRMGQDKGALAPRGMTQVERAFSLLEPLCDSVVVSVRRAQAGLEPYDRLPLVFDTESVEGPAAGLLAVWETSPESALLVLAVDMPFVDAAMLEALAAGRNPDRVATVFRQAGGQLEPLCAIWEPAAAEALSEIAARGEHPSPRRYLESAAIEVLEPADSGRLASVNTPEELEDARQSLEQG